MSDNAETRDAVLAALTEVAPEVGGSAIADDVALRDQVDLDSMDWLRFLVAVDRRLGVDIPERDYARLRTVADIVGYVGRHRPSPTTTPTAAQAPTQDFGP